MASSSSTLEYSLENFGPAVPGQFDFTLLFENTFLSIVPSMLLLLVLPFRLIVLRRASRKVQRSHLYENKIVRLSTCGNNSRLANGIQLFLLVFTCLQIAILVWKSTIPVLRTPTSLVASTLSVVDAIGLCALSRTEHVRILLFLVHSEVAPRSRTSGFSEFVSMWPC